jgi:predicted outer membrane protein
MRAFFAASVVSLILAGCAGQQEPVAQGPLYAGPGPAASTAVGTDPAQQVLSRLHRFSQLGIELGQIASANAASDDVKRLATDIAAHRRELDARVRLMARQQNITLVEPTPFSRTDREYMTYQNEVMRDLRSLRGEDFDHAYLTTLTLQHSELLPILRDLAPQIVDQEMKALLTNAIPVLENEYARGLSLLSRGFRSGKPMTR